MTNRHSAHLNMIRGLAAILVLVGHVRGLFLVDYPELREHKRLLLPFFAVTGLGHQAVMIFFVLSGFLIGGGVLATKDRWSWKRYSINRLTRLYVVLLPALLLTAALDHFARAAPGGHTYFDLPVKHFNAQPLASRQSLSVFLGNVVFLQTISVPVFGSDSPLWSLANEFWYYVLFPSVALALSRGRCGLVHRLFAGSIAIFLLVWLPAGILGGFLIWLLGVAVYLTPSIMLSVTTRRLCITVSAVLFSAILALSRTNQLPADYGDFMVAIGFALWLACLIRTGPSPDDISSTYRTCAKLLSSCSYSVYAVHFPIVMLIRCLAGTMIWQPDTTGLSMWVGISCTAFLAGYLFSALTEKHTDSVREIINGYSSSSTRR